MTTESTATQPVNDTGPICSNVVCPNTQFLTDYVFADGSRATYCTEHSGAAVMNGARPVGPIAVAPEKRKKIARADEMLLDLALLIANNASMKTRLDEREKRGQSVDRSVLEAGLRKEQEDREALRAYIRSI